MEDRLAKIEARLSSLESFTTGLDKSMAVLEHKLDQLISLISSINTTIRNSLIALGIAGIIWAIAQQVTQ